MSQFESSMIRNIAVAGHGDTGKTSIVSSLLFTSGGTKRHLKVDEGNTVTDFDEDEINRRITISTSICSTQWKKHKINLLDTPGYSDFICDAYPALASVDIAAFVIGGGSGDEFNLERLWDSGGTLPKARIFLINKLDKENTSFETSLKNAQNLSPRAIPVALPIGKELEFKGIVDIMDNRALHFDSATGKLKHTDVPADMADQIEEARMALIEAIAEADDSLLEKYLEGEALSPEEMKSALKIAILNGQIYPVIPFSANNNIGTAFLLDFIVDYLPSPTDVPAKKAADMELVCKPDGMMVAQVFKTIVDPFSGKFSIFRVYSGTFKPDQQINNVTQDETEKVTSVYYLQGKSQEQTPGVVAGDIGAIVKAKSVKTGDTLGSSDCKVKIKPLIYPSPLISYAFTPQSKPDEEKISSALTRLAEEDPTLRYDRNMETNELVVSGMGQLHIDVTQDRLKRKFGVHAIVSRPRIPYKETVKGTADVRYRHKKQSGGAGQFGEVAIRLMPLPAGEESIDGLRFVDMVVGGVIPNTYIPSVEKGIRSTMIQGIIAGYRVKDIKVELYDGKSHPVDSKDIAFQIAGAQALKQAFQQAKPILLEPIMKARITVPETNMGDIIGDLNSKRGRVMGMESEGKKQVIIAQVPLSEMQMYEPELRSMTGGRGSFTMAFETYEELPSNLADQVVAQMKKHAE
ncbi:elongation factor G [bacterium]|nr:elongation factor G [candidate division CSSED10-310 bacterium]